MYSGFSSLVDLAQSSQFILYKKKENSLVSVDWSWISSVEYQLTRNKMPHN